MARCNGNPVNLYCTWNVDRAWQGKLRGMEPIAAAEIYKMLRIIRQETDDILFQDYFGQLLDTLPDLSEEFNSYFVK